MVVSQSWLGVHLAQTLVALNALALLGLLEQPGHGGLEARHLLPLVAALDVGARSHQIAQGLRELGDAQVFRRIEELARYVFLGGQAMLEALQIDAMAAGGQRLARSRGSGAIRRRSELSRCLQIAAPIPQRIDAVERLGASASARTAAAPGSAHRSGAPSARTMLCTSTYFRRQRLETQPGQAAAPRH